ncbi:Glycerol-3-phosphate acyltransferase, chloroplastic [Vitis vinifera]|uniref:Glycerol-3-phosphate acyltransferase, chloroplastic n=1 Tax=Vitis vinifera TaxID=29760 RepID=A0A438GKJ7_VITVI|nr:Glycerol-3-phosphate acyltransferase, chloroplastic [Vitis vinifera]
MEEKLQQGHNIVLISNHQTEADPAVIALLLESTNPLIAENMIYVAGDRVVTDPLCKPFSMGRNLLCVYSKKHMNDVPELAEMKRRANTRSLKEMALLLRGGRSRFVVESKSFEILVEDLGGKMKGCIWERSRGVSSWIRFEEASLRCLLEGVEACCREVDNQRWVFDWMEGNRRNGQSSGWNSLAERLRGLGVAPSGSFKVTSGPEISLKLKGGESVWLEVGEREVQGRGLLLFDFELPFENSNADEAWVRVVGLPLHLWSLEVFKRIEDGCGGFVAVDEDTRSLSELYCGGNLHLGSRRWCRREVSMGGQSKVGRIDVSLAGGFPSTPPVKVSGVETDVRGWVGGSTSLVRGGRESSFNRLDVFGLGLEGLCCGPIGLDLGEAQGPFNEIQRRKWRRYPLVGLSMMAFETAERGLLTDEALRKEASRGAVFVEYILADGRNGEMASKGEKMVAGEGCGAVSARGAAGGVVVFWHNRVLELVGMEVGLFSISCRFKNCEDGFLWIFTRVYGPTLKRYRGLLWEELGVIRGLWSDPWCIGGDFNVIRFPSKRSRVGRLSGSMRSVLSQGRCLITFPILLDGGGVRRGPSPFRFENMWLKEEGFKELLKGWWQGLNYSGLEFDRIGVEEAARLEEMFSVEEVFLALSKLNGDKAPSQTGFPCLLAVLLGFCQKRRGDDLCDFRPISLVGGLYKLLAKVLANRLKKVVSKVVSPTQNAFVEGRQILNAALIANEAIDSLLKRDETSVLCKLDLEKAYDHINWDFLLTMMQKMGFGEKWAGWIRLKSGTLPSTYLGLPLGAPLKSVVVWDGVEERMRKRLALWKRQFISKEGESLSFEALWKFGEEGGGWNSREVREGYGVGFGRKLGRKSRFRGASFGALVFLQRWVFFAWEASWGKVLTQDQLKRRGWILANRCFLCCAEEETINHILVHCPKVRVLWDLVFSLFGVNWVLPLTVKDTLLGWFASFVDKKHEKTWQVAF